LRRLLPLLCCALAACVAQPPRAVLPETLLEGVTMGSAWTVKLAGELPAPAEELRAGVQARFDEVDQALSTYKADSALSRFNRDTSGDWVGVDPELAMVMAYARELAELSDGAYDLTVGPLVNLWGFGPDPARREAPNSRSTRSRTAHARTRAFTSTCRRSARAAASTASPSTSRRAASLTTSSTCPGSCARRA
jgi:thiamine biosynthesis lipoprotein